MWSREKLNQRQNHHVLAAKQVLQFPLYTPIKHHMTFCCQRNFLCQAKISSAFASAGTLAIGAGRFSQIASPMQGEFCNGGIFKPTITKFPLPAGAI